MHRLSSKNYKTVAVRFRGDEDTSFIMPRSTGDKLMAYLVSNPSGKHVTITSDVGYQKTVHTSEIISADPQYEYETVDWTKFENWGDIQEEIGDSHEPKSSCVGEKSINLAVIHAARGHGATILKDAAWRAVTKKRLWEERQDWCDAEKGTCGCRPVDA